MQKHRHRGADPEDERAFEPKAWPVLRQATSDLCWLLEHGYALASAAELVGNRYKLTTRQRLALGRCACARADAERRASREVSVAQLLGEELWIDGFNVLTALETALAGGFILIGTDGCCRDVAGIHRRYHKVEETVPALQLTGECMQQWGVSKSVWLLDSPIANSGRLEKIILGAAHQAGWNWEVQRVINPDRVLSKSEQIVATADRVILDRCVRWFNLARTVIAARIATARLVQF